MNYNSRTREIMHTTRAGAQITVDTKQLRNIFGPDGGIGRLTGRIAHVSESGLGVLNAARTAESFFDRDSPRESRFGNVIPSAGTIATAAQLIDEVVQKTHSLIGVETQIDNSATTASDLDSCMPDSATEAVEPESFDDVFDPPVAP